MDMEWDNQQAMTKDREDQGQTIENRSKMKIRSQETNKIFLAFFNIKIKLELKIKRKVKLQTHFKSTLKSPSDLSQVQQGQTKFDKKFQHF